MSYVSSCEIWPAGYRTGSETDEAEWLPHLDGLVAAQAHHRLLFEDHTVRILEVSVESGERENLHHHRWPSIMVVLARSVYVNRNANGTEVPSCGHTAGFHAAMGRAAAAAACPCD